MKKILLFLSVLILSISGCDNSADTPAFKNRPSMVRHSTVAPAGVDAGEEVTTPRLTMKLSANQAASGMPQLRGVNLTGGELEWGTKPVTNPVSGTDYLFVSHQDIDYLASKNINFVRLLFSWEAIQPNGVSTPLATTGNNGIYVSTFIDRVNYASSKGMYVMIEPHGASSDNFAKYKGNFVGSSAVPNSAFADLWSRLAMQFKGNPYVVYGLSNEPNGMSTVQWFQAAQAAIVAIRDAGSTGLILVPGTGWTGASSWTQNWYDTATTKVSNAQAYLKYINDPLGNTAVSVHNYFDADASGGATSVVSSTIGSERLKVVVDWAKANGVKVHVSEFATPNSSAGQTTLNDFLNYVNANSSTVIGWAWWAYGPPTWWGGYQFTLDPSKNYTVDSYAMPWLSSNLVSPVLPVVDAGSDSGSTGGLDSGLVDAGQKVDAGSADAGVVSVASIRPATSTVANPGDQGFTSTKTVTASSGVPAGTYTLKVETRTQYSDNNTFCVTFILNNTNSTVDVDWSSMTVDLRGHTLQSSWNAVVVGNSGVITVTPNASSKTVLAGDRNSFGMCLNRQADKTKAHYQVLVKTLVW